MSRIYKYGYKLIPIYVTSIFLICVGLYLLAYPMVDYIILSDYLANPPKYFSFYSNDNYTILNLVAGFLLIFTIGVNVASFISSIIAIYWSEFTNYDIKENGINLIEIFINIPFVVLGYLLLIWFNSFLNLGDSQLTNVMVSGLVLGGMMLPNLIYRFIKTLQLIPYNQREGAYSLGASRYKTAMMVLIPSQTKLFVATIITVATRALNEILIILLVSGFCEEKVEIIILIFALTILSTWISQRLKKSHFINGAI